MMKKLINVKNSLRIFKIINLLILIIIIHLMNNMGEENI
jgi:hypothetical protein